MAAIELLTPLDQFLGRPFGTSAVYCRPGSAAHPGCGPVGTRCAGPGGRFEARRMSIILAAVASVLAALLEISVIPGLTSVGQPNLVFLITVVVTMMIGVEEGLTVAFLGGLMTDLLLPGHQLGGTSLVLLGMSGVTATIGRFLPQRRVIVAAVLVLVLAMVFQPLEILVLAATAGTPATVDLTGMLPPAIVDALLAIPVAVILRSAWLRYGAHDRIEW